MSTPNIAQLNDQFAIPDHISFSAGSDGLPVAKIANEYATASVAVQGGHVLTYHPVGQQPILWLSDYSRFGVGQAIRGGIPICWPWFGPHPTDADKPAHGFARINVWHVVDTAVTTDGSGQIRLELTDTERIRDLWPHPFRLELLVIVGPSLEVSLTTHNLAPQPITYGTALHSYFTVSDSQAITISGLEGCHYVDKVDSGRYKQQAGVITISEETDRVYLNTTSDCVIDDPGLARKIRIAKEGSYSTVVWNPWLAKAQRMADFGDDEYRSMVCVETANALEAVVTIPVGDTHRVTTRIELA